MCMKQTTKCKEWFFIDNTSNVKVGEALCAGPSRWLRAPAAPSLSPVVEMAQKGGSQW